MEEPTLLLDADLADQYRRIYRAQFREDVAAGRKIPFLFHLCLWGLFVFPVLYLSIPHRRRPWLYRARWLVLAACAAVNLWMVRNFSSANFAFAYGTGLIAAWGTIWNLTLLVWTRPQWDAKRVERYPNPEYNRDVSQKENESGRQATSSSAAVSTTNGHVTNGHASNGHASHGCAEIRQRKTQLAGNDANGSILESKTERSQFIYKWQEFPEGAPFLTRLDWAFDIATTMRLTGWNWAIHVLPPYRPPPWIDEENRIQAPLDSLPNRTGQGFERCRTRRQFFIERILGSLVPAYLLIDVCATVMTQDPYFILGPNELPLPPGLAEMNPFLLSLRRTSLSFIAVLVALRLAWDFGAVLLAFLCPPILGFRVDPWHLPSMTGSFTDVLDRGLAGFWGTWWHQTFRFGFAAPTNWLIRNGYIREKSTSAAVVGALVAFLQSGFIHAMGSYTTLPKTHWWEPPVFFFLSGVGTQLQSTVSKAFKPQIDKMPQWVRRAGNFLFVFVWLHLTCKWLVDDFGRCGLWLWEPVPFSIVRWLGLGLKGDYWWRWTSDDTFTWITGKHWWTTGFGV
ncbi:hypothetical protein PFICI_01882 [Pestalotiopsis fici W106-1]|uniref:Wax synthase domain-containing protein n=1 Tax=Pestalotiopsis fici (strain W106-1 / CGMCC3.15140) TaxID=1229662 RepID=W3XPY8_PESFW|nr:uncharacterized protein PFICI_01882 [Pestalotiopsis fici W106-1]ETS88054.1 hypothetical protein PFICI_01882 [Pestalotiopsis fici W106-1]